MYPASYTLVAGADGVDVWLGMYPLGSMTLPLGPPPCGGMCGGIPLGLFSPGMLTIVSDSVSEISDWCRPGFSTKLERFGLVKLVVLLKL